jgi:hypothetical protein
MAPAPHHRSIFRPYLAAHGIRIRSGWPAVIAVYDAIGALAESAVVLLAPVVVANSWHTVRVDCGKREPTRICDLLRGEGRQRSTQAVSGHNDFCRGLAQARQLFHISGLILDFVKPHRNRSKQKKPLAPDLSQIFCLNINTRFDP